MQVLQIDDGARASSSACARSRSELDALLQDLLIGVTNFFRDPPAFAALEREVIPQLFEGKGPDDTVRVWVPGCSTGEEAYSIAILLREHMPKAQSAPRLQIFATDIDEHGAAGRPRIGRYPAAIAERRPAERGWSATSCARTAPTASPRDLREICLFSAHNLLRDAPFSKLDLISCRNLLIYLTPRAAEPADPAVPLRAQRAAAILFLGTLGERDAPHAACSPPSTSRTASSAAAPQTERRLPEFPLTAPEAARAQARRDAARRGRAGASAGAGRTPAARALRAGLCRDQRRRRRAARLGAHRQVSRAVGRRAAASTSSAWRVRACGPTCAPPCTRRPAPARSWCQRNVTVGTNGGRQTDRPRRPAAAHDPARRAALSWWCSRTSAASGAAARRETADDAPTTCESANLRQLEMELRATTRAAADHHRGARILQRGAEVGQRGAVAR